MSRKISITAISTALAIISFAGSIFIPILNVVLAVLASFFVVIPVFYNLGIKYSILCYLVTSALGFVLFGSYVVQMLLNVVFIMPFTIAKIIVDKHSNKTARILIKYICANLLAAVMIALIYILSNEFFNENLKYWWIVIIVVELMVIPYDYVLDQGLKVIKGIIIKINSSHR